MKILIILFSLLSGGIMELSGSDPADEEKILAIMDQQQRCWNEGNLDCFMKGYLPSDSLMFIGKNGIVYGYQNTLERYRKSYPDRTSMGQLNFNIIQLNQLSSEYYSMIGKWTLKRSTDNLEGYFSLIFKKINGEWFIIKDHSS
ncbi:nuclear transport factor 2 family protein [Porifericola rhodea]|uniref:YybH family protein n=1 Tax=Porifericola rhodea TaxID=930972 RepID=UPI0026660B57|nr:nuclear transport factor 2 family protein [Porifericola rhodea]WKN30985.1 nuclear transport factor 2 family protein [Porifericola rhodea]